MSERSIFLAALDIADQAQRSACLVQACGSDSAQRKHIEELIAVEAKLGGFLAQPHVETEGSDKVAALHAWQRAPAFRHEWRDRVPLHSDSGLPVVRQQQQQLNRTVSQSVRAGQRHYNYSRDVADS